MFIVPVEDPTPIDNIVASTEADECPQSKETYLQNSIAATTNASIELMDNLPRIPISHLVATNHQYPSLTNVPTNIAKSFAPIFIQPHTQSENDIYTDYVNNPYNQTLKIDHEPLVQSQSGLPTVEDQPLTIQKDSNGSGGVVNNVANVFQSANYFGSDTINIPPGSEVLFGGP